MHVIILIAFEYFTNVPLVYRVGVQLNHRGSAFIKEICLINVTNFWIKFLSPPSSIVKTSPHWLELKSGGTRAIGPIEATIRRPPCGPDAPDDGRRGGRGEA
jgi:hypothetical protein